VNRLKANARDPILMLFIGVILVFISYRFYLSGRALLYLLPVTAFTGTLIFLKKSENIVLILLLLGPTSLYFSAIQIDLRSLIFGLIFIIAPLTYLDNSNHKYSDNEIQSLSTHLKKSSPYILVWLGIVHILSFQKFSEFALACLVFPLVVHLLILLENRFGIIGILNFYVSGIAIASMISLVQYFEFLPKLPGARDNLAFEISDYGSNLIRFSGTVGDYELFGWSLAIAFSLSIGLATHYKNRSKNHFRTFLVLLILFGACGVLTGNRATLAEFMFSIVFQLFFSNISILRKVYLIFVTILSAGTLLFLLDSRFLYFRRSLSIRGELSTGNLLSSRLDTWRGSISTIENFSLLGNPPSSLEFNWPHNLILWSVISCGFLGALIVIWLLLWILRMALILIKLRGAIAIGLSSSLLSTFFDSLLVEPVRLIPVYTIWLLLIGICYVFIRSRDEGLLIPKAIKLNE